MSMLLRGQPRVQTRCVQPSRPICRRLVTRAVAATEAAPKQVAKPASHGRLYNFAAGPAVLPVEVLEEAQADLLNWKGSGTSVMEMSHRGKEFSKIIQQAEDDLRQLLNIPDNYQVQARPWSMSTRRNFLLHAAAQYPCVLCRSQGTSAVPDVRLFGCHSG